jgi:hypothetical protein
MAKVVINTSNVPFAFRFAESFSDKEIRDYCNQFVMWRMQGSDWLKLPIPPHWPSRSRYREFRMARKRLETMLGVPEEEQW